jgi:hypothetical protein
MGRWLAHSKDQHRLIGVRQQHLFGADLWAGTRQHAMTRRNFFDHTIAVAQRREAHSVAGSNPCRRDDRLVWRVGG